MEAMFKRVQPQKYYMQIMKQIRDSINSGELKIGDKLPSERDLAESFGASRASIREAMSALEILGLIESKSGQGTFVKADGSEGTVDGEMLKVLLADHEPYEIYETRLELEPILAALAAERATPDEKKSLQKCVNNLERLTRELQGDKDVLDLYMEEDRKFHLEIGRCAHNNVLFTVFSGVNLMLKETHWKVLKKKAMEKEGSLEKYMQEHYAIYESIKNKKPEIARIEMKSHIDSLQEDIFPATL